MTYIRQPFAEAVDAAGRIHVPASDAFHAAQHLLSELGAK